VILPQPTATPIYGIENPDILDINTPATDRELFIAKMLSGWLASIAIALCAFLIYSINVNAAAWSQMQRIFFPNTPWFVLVIWVVPALSGSGVSLMVMVSARA
jgi:hypothetical protein